MADSKIVWNVANVTLANLERMCRSIVLRDSIAIMDSRRFLHFGYINVIEREDGSGHKFNITMHTKNGSETFFVDASVPHIIFQQV